MKIFFVLNFFFLIFFEKLAFAEDLQALVTDMLVHREQPKKTSDGTSTQDLKDLLETLENPVTKDKLIAQLRGFIALNKDEKKEQVNFWGDVWEHIKKEMTRTVEEISYGIEIASEIKIFRKWFEMEANRDPFHKWLMPLMYVGIAFCVGIFMGMWTRRLLKKPKEYLYDIKVHQRHIFFMERMAQIFIWVLPYAIFALFSYIVCCFLPIEHRINSLTQDLLYAGMVIRVVQMSLKAIISPKHSHKRAFFLSDHFAKKFYHWIIRVTGWGLWVYFIIYAMKDLGLPLKVSNLFNQILGLIITIQVIYFVLQNRNMFKKYLDRSFDDKQKNKKRPHFQVLEALSQMWYIPVVISVCIFYLAVFFGVGGFPYLMRQTGISVGIFFVSRWLINSLKDYDKKHFEDAFLKIVPRLHARIYHRVYLLEMCLIFLIYIFAIYVQFLFWKINFLDLFIDGQNNFYPFVRLFFQTFLVLFMAYSLWVGMDIFIETYLAKEDLKELTIGKSRSGRIRTLVPIIRKIFLVMLLGIVFFVVLGSFGFDTGPLLGGVALISFAISLGAQSLTKDLITGFFIILEDTISVGDIVDIDGKKGLVETVTIRSMRIRDDFGHVHTIPFGEVKIITNMTREYAWAIVYIGVSYEDDTDYILGLIRKTGEEFMEEPEYKHLVLGEIDMKGIDKFLDSSVSIQCAIKVKPGEQFTVRRAFNLYVKRKFDQLGVNMPYPQQVVHNCDFEKPVKK